MKKIILITAILGLVACVPKKINFELPKDFRFNVGADTKHAINLGQTLIDTTVKAKAQSLDDYTRSELMNLIIKNEAVFNAVDQAAAGEVECYSDQQKHLNFIEMSAKDYDYNLNLICFNPKELIQPGDDEFADVNSQVKVNAMIVSVNGALQWAKEGVKVSTNGSPATAKVKPYPIYVLEAIQKTLVRVK